MQSGNRADSGSVVKQAVTSVGRHMSVQQKIVTVLADDAFPSLADPEKHLVDPVSFLPNVRKSLT